MNNTINQALVSNDVSIFVDQLPLLTIISGDQGCQIAAIVSSQKVQKQDKQIKTAGKRQKGVTIMCFEESPI